MNTETMVADAQKRVANFVARSAGQHIRSMREAHIDDGFNTDNSADQIERDKASIIRDVLCEMCSLGASKKRTDTVMALLCSIAGVSQELLTGTPATY